MVSPWWRTHPSSLHLLETMTSGGAHKIWKLFTYGTPWTTRIDRTRWLRLRSRLNGRYGKRKIKGGHHSYDKRVTTNFLIYTKTIDQTDGVLRSRDGDGEETSEPQSLRNRSNVGWKPQQTYQRWLRRHCSLLRVTRTTCFTWFSRDLRHEFYRVQELHMIFHIVTFELWVTRRRWE